MLYHPNVVIYLWFLPLTVWVLLPLTLGVIRFSLKLISQLLFVENEQPSQVQEIQNRRQYSRVSIAPVEVQVSDGHRSVQAQLANTSRFGLCLKNLPEKIVQTADRLTVTFTGQGIRTLRVQPVWVRANGTGLNIGAKVEENSIQWQKFLHTQRELMRA